MPVTIEILFLIDLLSVRLEGAAYAKTWKKSSSDKVNSKQKSPRELVASWNRHKKLVEL